MKVSWLWDRDISDEEIKKIFSNIEDLQYIPLAALLLSRTNSAQDVFKEYIKQKEFFLLWSRIKRQMRKNSWNDPRIEYWQAIYDTLKKKPEFIELRPPKEFVEAPLPIYREIGTKIREARQRSGLTQQKLAEKLNISQQIISRIESGKQNVSVKTLSRICESLGIPFDSEKFGFVERPFATSMQHLLPFGNLSPNDFERLVYWVVEKSKKFDRVEKYGMVGDKGVDIVAYRYNTAGKPEKWYFQCKNYKKIAFAPFRGELDKIADFSTQDLRFKPDVIVFVTGCPVSPSCKDKTKEYAERLSLGSVLFWTDVELDEKAKETGADKEFFDKGFNTKELKVFIDDVKRAIMTSVEKITLNTDGEPTKKDDLNKSIDECVKLIHSTQIEEAKTQLYLLLEKIKNDPNKYSYELTRIYNNLGVCYNRPKEDGGSEEKAEKYFREAIKINPVFIKANTNLASLFLNRGDLECVKQAYDIVSPLWGSSKKDDATLFQVFIWSLFRHFSPQKALDYYEKSEDAKSLVSKDPLLLSMIGTMYFSEKNFNQAIDLVEEALKISTDFAKALQLKARVLMGRAQEDAAHPYYGTMPEFKDYKDIWEARELLMKALDSAKAEKNRFLENQIKTDLHLCEFWLSGVADNIRKEIDVASLTTEEQEQLVIQDSLIALKERDSEQSYKMLVGSSVWDKLPYREKTRVAHIFLLKGFPEEAKNILKQLENEATKEEDVIFWVDASLIEVLLDDKNFAIEHATKARKFSEGTGFEKMAFAHFNALMLRYASSGEVDRMMEGMFAYDTKYPDEKVIKPIPALTPEGKPTEEIKSILIKQKEWYEGVRDGFKAQPILTYYLEEIFKRPYAEILSFQNDPQFTIELTIPNEQFEKRLSSNFEESEAIVFDYSSLLNFSKMNLLGYLDRFSKKLYIPEELFAKIQYELFMFEQDDLRRLWRFLRKSKEITIVETNQRDREQKLLGILDKWVIDSIELAKKKNAIIVADDLRFLRFLSSEQIKGCNSFVILKNMRSKAWIDNKVYATSLGDLAERFYTFLPFSGDDLFQIVMEDKSKIRLRSYHLVNQLFLSGSIVSSFTNVFVRFIDLLWKTGSLPEDKIRWLDFFTKDIILKFINNQGGVKDNQELENVVPDFVKIWIIAVQRSSRDEIVLLEKTAEEILVGENLAIFKDNVVRFIGAKKVSLGI